MFQSNSRVWLVTILSIVLVGMIATGAVSAHTDPSPMSRQSSANNAAVSLITGDDEVTLYTTDGQTIRGNTSLPSGTSLTVRLRSSSAQTPFIKQQSVNVNADGTFTATFDLSEIAINSSSEIAVSVVGPDGQKLVETTALLMAGTPTPEVTTTAPPTTVETTATDTPGQPGFGILLAVLAIAATVLVGRRT